MLTEGAEISLPSSRLLGFATLSVEERLRLLVSKGLISEDDAQILLGSQKQLSTKYAESFIENCIGSFSLPLGLATNFIVDGEPVLIPMAIEESSVVAAASYAAKLTLPRGGFFSQPVETIATAQVQFKVDPDLNTKSIFRECIEPKLKEFVAPFVAKLTQRGGGLRGFELRELTPFGDYVIHIHVDTCEAMGANIVNTVAEQVGALLPQLIPCEVGSKILTNLTLHRVARVRCELDFSVLGRQGLSGEDVAHRVVSVYEFACMDPFRATTHNKGIMNGIDPVIIATGNDWRAVEAGCHAYASLTGVYKPLTKWFIEGNCLIGEIAAPIAVGTVGGVTRLHPGAGIVFRLLGHPSSSRLSSIIASVGLAQNFSAIRALGCEGIQKGHMALHEKNLEMMRYYDNLPNISVVKS